jgi:hypothetical protein
MPTNQEPIEDRTQRLLAEYNKSLHPSEFTDQLAILLCEWLANHSAYQATVRAGHKTQEEITTPRSVSGFRPYGDADVPAPPSYTDRIGRTSPGAGPDPLVREPGPSHG